MPPKIRQNEAILSKDTFAGRNTSCVDAQSYDPDDKKKILKELTEKSSISDIDTYIKEFRAFGASSSTENVDEGKTNDSVNEEGITKNDIEQIFLELAELKRENTEVIKDITELKVKNNQFRGE